ncbi:alpha/beta fold hydrolase [Planctomonas psychrotolerans]|uniref:alpha/beta fold hydrolase n=1 Tax=Planctomonas psychrotolerans TaxID=2528712 RepID=UPI0012397787|nr:alpha/beta hydrolase [Planctomonas psychrotolerans]
MATFALIHGGGSTAWDWHLVSPLLERAGHDVVAVDLPIEDAGKTLEDYARTVADAVGDATGVIVVGHSLGGFTAPLVCGLVSAVGLVFLTAMIPAPGELFEDWWTNTGHDREVLDEDPDVQFFTAVPEHLVRAAKATERHERGDWMTRPWPASGLPDVPTLGILCRDDAFFPAAFMRRQVRERLGTDPVEIPGGHYVALSHPDAVAAALDDFARSVGA